MAIYMAVLSYLSEHNLHYFTFSPKSGKSLKVLIHYLLINTSLQDITLALEVLGCGITNVKKKKKTKY